MEQEGEAKWMGEIFLNISISKKGSEADTKCNLLVVMKEVDQWVRFLDFHHLSACLDISACSEETVEIFLSTR